MRYIAVFCCIFFASCVKREALITGLEGKPLPEFSIQLSDSTTVLHTTSLSNKNPKVFFYFSPTCPYCRSQIKEIINNYDKLSKIEFYFITSWSFDYMKQIADHYHIDKYRNIKIGVDHNERFIDYYKVNQVPYLALLNKNNVLTTVYIGKVSTSDILKAINKNN